MTVTDIQLQNSTGKVIALGHREDDYVLESVDWGTARVSIKPIYYFPTDDSERMLYQQWEPRLVSIIGWVIGKDEADIEAKSQALEQFVIVQSETDIIYNHYHLTFLPTAEADWANTEVDNNEVWRKFHITGVCIDPLWKNKSVFSEDNTVDTPMFSFPLAFNKEDEKVVFGIHYAENTLFLNYDGPSSGAIITVLSSGILSDLVIQSQNGTAVQRFSLDGTFDPHTKIVIDTREGFNTVTADGVDITDRVLPGSHWLRILKGLTLFTFYQQRGSGSIPLFHFPLTLHQEENRVVFGIQGRDDTRGQLDVNVTIRQTDLFEVQT